MGIFIPHSHAIHYDNGPHQKTKFYAATSLKPAYARKLLKDNPIRASNTTKRFSPRIGPICRAPTRQNSHYWKKFLAQLGKISRATARKLPRHCQRTAAAEFPKRSLGVGETGTTPPETLCSHSFLFCTKNANFYRAPPSLQPTPPLHLAKSTLLFGKKYGTFSEKVRYFFKKSTVL